MCLKHFSCSQVYEHVIEELDLFISQKYSVWAHAHIGERESRREQRIHCLLIEPKK